MHTVLVCLQEPHGYIPDLAGADDLGQTHGRGDLKVFRYISHEIIHQDQGSEHGGQHDQNAQEAWDLTNLFVPENHQIEGDQEERRKIRTHHTEKEGEGGHSSKGQDLLCAGRIRIAQVPDH